MNDIGHPPPNAQRGLLPLIMGALAVGQGIYGAVAANQQKQRQKGHIAEAHRIAKARMSQQQGVGRQMNLESLNQRGLLLGGVSPIQASLTAGAPTARTIADQSRADLEREYGLDRRALDAEAAAAQNQNRAQALNAQIGSIAGGISGVASAVGASQEMAALNKTASTPVASALLSGSAWDGIHPVDPLGDPTSKWHIPSGITIDGMGLNNSQFNVPRSQGVG